MNRYRIFSCMILLFLNACRQERVTEVIDGDTFRTARGDAVRLLNINAPELADPGGDIAKEALTLLLLNQKVRLVKDLTDRDDYDRLLRHVYVGRLHINAEMVRMGLAETRSYPPDTMFIGRLKELEKIAIRNNRGFWSFPVFQPPDTIGSITEHSPDVPNPKPVISWRDAAKYYGKTMTVEGKIVASNNTGKVCFLNFHKDWKSHFTAVIFSSDFARFPSNPEDHYLNRTVRITGLVKAYKGKPEIIIKDPDQIKILE